MPTLQTQATKILLAGIAMAAPMLLIKLFFPFNPDWHTIARLAWLAVAGGLGGISFLAAVHYTQLLNLADLAAPILRKLKRRRT